jgi:hypothetical protein
MKHSILLKHITLLLLALLSFSLNSVAKNLDLSTVPDRDSVQLTIYNSEDLTLVRESRIVSFKKGINPLQFSWANTLIDPTSVELEFKDMAGKLEVMDTTFPHHKPQMLYWNVQADADVEARIEISYFTSGISWNADYVAIANSAESDMGLEGFVRVTNKSGEPYANAQVRLVVGKINLVEKIAELARVSVNQVDKIEQSEYKKLRTRVARKVMSPQIAMESIAGFADEVPAPKQVAKEGLGEYFIYTIEGRETIPDGWSKRLRSFDAAEVPMQVVYRYRAEEYGNQLVRLYLLRNDKKSGLGATPIPNGKVQIFRHNGHKGLSYMATQTLKYVPIGDRMELNLGVDPEVVFELIKQKVERENIWVRVNRGKMYKKVGEGLFKVDHDARVAGWDERQLYSQRIRNYSNRKIRVEVRRSYSGDVTFRSQLKAKSHNYRTVEFKAEISAGDKKELKHEVIIRSGYNAKQQRVEVIEG